MKTERLHELFEREKVNELKWTGKCSDCKKETIVLIKLGKEGFEIYGGAVYEPVNDEVYKGEKFYLKCDFCFDKNPRLESFQECEVYSRCVGYLRPTKQFNPGKKAEFNDREMFNLEKT